jgi:glycosyltransferase involved in cell wall biosynthesis
LAKHGLTSSFSAEPFGVFDSQGPDTVVFVKAFGARDVVLAREAARRGVSVILDVADNVFATGYRAHSSENLRRMAKVASAVVTTGPALRDVLEAELTDCPVHVVPDPVETPEETEAAARMLLAERFRRARHERRREVPRALAGGIVNGLASSPRLRRPSRRKPRARPQVTWFGNTGSVEPRFGLVNLADIAAEIEAAAHEIPFTLVVVTGDRAAYRRLVEPIGVDSAFQRWDRLGIFRVLRESAVVILPNSRDAFSICKSANRSVLTLSQGTPVVATRIPALDPLDGAMLFDDFRHGILAYLRDPGLAAEHLHRAGAVIQREFASEVIAQAWLAVFDARLPTKVPV